jgi:hypothetical protein
MNSILDEFAVEGNVVWVELMAALAELGPLKGHRGREAAVRQDGAGRGCRALGTSRRTKVLVLAHMTGRADQAGLLQTRIKGRVRTIGATVLALWQLFTERRMAGGAEGVRRQIALLHGHQLTIDAWSHTATVATLLPVLILLGMAYPAVLGM